MEAALDDEVVLLPHPAAVSVTAIRAIGSKVRLMRLSLDPQDPNSVRFPRERGQHGDENFAGDTLSGLFDVTGGDLMDVHLEDHVGQPGAALYYRAMNILTMVLLIVSVGGVVRLDTRSAMIAVVLSAFLLLSTRSSCLVNTPGYGRSYFSLER